MFKNEWQFKVRFGDTDAAGIVYYPNFYRWMDQGFQELFTKMGFPLSKLFSVKLGTPLVETHCQFRSPLYFDDMVNLVSVVTEVKNKVIKVENEFFHGNVLVANGYEIRAWVNLSDGKLKAQPIPEEIRQILCS